ncbi:hypothetical protein UFOVP566_70 [uncultured Caudovirales phage]|uniref:Uncharacterized protein n=1 Tax=uncultured Caudovirales phage TaxID=2100421 RepID=A0A6J5MU57_9CAUD|nr:hypothetical protein UFOVP294_15 [uncultured Caudovirales phage]CAB4150715.1 hypothetical protein UFOVP566_70 [uncultured Caudovirales phage]
MLQFRFIFLDDVIMSNLHPLFQSILKPYAPPSNPIFEVQTRFINTWENVWTEDDKPLFFSSIEEAQLEIDDLVMHHDYSINDYRIVEIIK